MKLYAQLQLQPDQRAAMAERWRSWCRRRRGLDHQQAAAIQQLQARPCLLNALFRGELFVPHTINGVRGFRIF
jgi:hypothetical protein